MPRHPRFITGSFVRNEAGSLTIFGLIMFMLMMIGAGIALDAMRSEVDRTELQYTIDRAVLAAAGRDQVREGEVIVDDYLRAAGIDRDAFEITATNTFGTRVVTVTAQARTPTLFMDLLGIDTLVQPVSTEAREVETELELSLVLDISGSMNEPDNGGSRSKIVALRAAAKDFVNELLADREDETYVSFVPYNEWVNAGSILPRYFPLSTEHDFSRCVVFQDGDYDRTDFQPGAALQRKGHFDKDSTSNDPGPVKKPECTVGNYAEVLPWSNDVDELGRRIDALNAGGSTAINVGVKVGTMLLDPSVRPRLQAMADDTALDDHLRVDRGFVGRPVDYRTDGTFKVLVVMTDGVNNTQRDLRPEFKSGPSWVVVFQDRRNNTCDDDGDPTDCPDYNAAGPTAGGNPFGSASSPDAQTPNLTQRYSFWSKSTNSWYVPHLPPDQRFRDAPWGGGEAIRLDWPVLFGAVPTRWLAGKLGDDASKTLKDQYKHDGFWKETHYKNSKADGNLSDICSAARAQGIIVYAIAFNAPSGGRNAMRDCAGANDPDMNVRTQAAARYFDVAGLEIDVAFDDILAAVTRLRLYQ